MDSDDNNEDKDNNEMEQYAGELQLNAEGEEGGVEERDQLVRGIQSSEEILF